MLKKLADLVRGSAPRVRRVGAEEGLEECRNREGILVDVREPGEVQAKPVKGAINVPRGIVEIKLPELYADPDTPIYLHCASGGRATLAAEQLQRLGYTNVTAIVCNVDELCQLGGVPE